MAMSFDLMRARGPAAAAWMALSAWAAGPTAAEAQTAFELAFHTNAAEIHLVRADGSQRTFLTTGFGAAWSPSGERLLFADNAESPDLFVVASDGSGRTQLTEGLSARMPSWAKDGAHIAFVGEQAQPDGSHQRVYLADAPAPGPDPSPLAPSLLFSDSPFEHEHDPAWSPDSRRLAFVGESRLNGQTVANIYVAELDDAMQVLALWPATHFRAGTLLITPLSWSPDGSALYFSHKGDIWVVDASGALDPVRAVAEPADSEREPGVSPDGSRVVCLRTNHQEGYAGLTLRSLGTDRPLDLNTGLAFAPAWNPAPLAARKTAAETPTLRR
jgi:Tol biopolymer transport system component